MEGLSGLLLWPQEHVIVATRTQAPPANPSAVPSLSSESAAAAGAVTVTVTVAATVTVNILLWPQEHAIVDVIVA